MIFFAPVDMYRNYWSVQIKGKRCKLTINENMKLKHVSQKYIDIGKCNQVT